MKKINNKHFALLMVLSHRYQIETIPNPFEELREIHIPYTFRELSLICCQHPRVNKKKKDPIDPILHEPPVPILHDSQFRQESRLHEALKKLRRMKYVKKITKEKKVFYIITEKGYVEVHRWMVYTDLEEVFPDNAEGVDEFYFDWRKVVEKRKG
jgi:hypothetical protein